MPQETTNLIEIGTQTPVVEAFEIRVGARPRIQHLKAERRESVA
jgi:hypothetical protein